MMPRKERDRGASEWASPSTVPGSDEWLSLTETVVGRRRTSDIPLSVIVPVYGARALTLDCLWHLLRSTPRTPFEVLVIDDCGPDQQLRRDLQLLADLSLVSLIRNEENLGFPAAVNIGFERTAGDVVVLNSDTRVFGDWLDRLVDTARSIPRCATVTPLTNNGEIASYPGTLRDNVQALELSPAELDGLAARVNSGRAAVVPTGVGFCMLVTREALEVVKGFDTEAFGQGYGEENDLCQRALQAGFTNVIAADTFVWHAGGASFGASKLARVERAVRLVEQRNPGYLASVSAFIESDPLREPRQRLDAARRGLVPASERVLFVSHNRGGGTERHVQQLARLHTREGKDVLITRPKGPRSLMIEASNGDILTNLDEIHLSSTTHVADLLKHLNLSRVHVHHVADLDMEGRSGLFRAIEAAALPYDFTVHDYLPLCPRITLISDLGRYCREPDVPECTRCLNTLGSDFGSPDMTAWLSEFADVLAGARSVFVPHADVARRIRQRFPNVSPTVRPHAEHLHFRTLPRQSIARASLEIVLVGALGEHKGSGVLANVARASRTMGLPLRFTVIGYTDRDEELRKIGNVEITGHYQDETLPALLSSRVVDLFWLPSVWPETFSYTLTAALASGRPTVTFDIGAPAERLREAGRPQHALPLALMETPELLAQKLHTMALEGEVGVLTLDYPSYGSTSEYYGASVGAT